jgi:hypothetical protein
MQERYGAGKTSSGKIGIGTRQNEELRNDEKMGRDCGKAQNATLA